MSFSLNLVFISLFPSFWSFLCGLCLSATGKKLANSTGQTHVHSSLWNLGTKFHPWKEWTFQKKMSDQKRAEIRAVNIRCSRPHLQNTIIFSFDHCNQEKKTGTLRTLRTLEPWEERNDNIWIPGASEAGTVGRYQSGETRRCSFICRRRQKAQAGGSFLLFPCRIRPTADWSSTLSLRPAGGKRSQCTASPG